MDQCSVSRTSQARKATSTMLQLSNAFKDVRLPYAGELAALTDTPGTGLRHWQGSPKRFIARFRDGFSPAIAWLARKQASIMLLPSCHCLRNSGIHANAVTA